jgi:hypothetical protein
LNFHRLEQLGHSRGNRTLHEETVTDLLMAEMAGREYTVSARCPGCGGDCPDWAGSGSAERGGVLVRALTKLEEGGNRRTGRLGVHADFVITADEYDAASSSQGNRQVRMLVQAKRIDPGSSFLSSARESKQYDKLIAAAQEHCAAPYYAIYVHQLHPHTSTATRCTARATAADRAIVLAPARLGDEDLLRRKFEFVLGRGRPLRCLGGCSCTRAPNPSTAWDSILAFVRSDFPNYEPMAVSSSGQPLDVADDMQAPNAGESGGLRKAARFVLRINAGRYKPGDTPRSGAQTDRAAREDSSTYADLLVVRLGRQSEATAEDDRGYVGYSSSMSAAERRDAARRYWRLDLGRAQRLRYIVAATGRQAIDAYQILPDGLTCIRDDRRGRRVEFDVTEVYDHDLRRQLMRRATERLANLRRGARNPVLYVGQA